MLSKWSIAGGLAIVIAGLVVDNGAAQERKGRGGFGGQGQTGSLAILARIEAVQTELGVSADAKDKLAALSEKYLTEVRELGGGRGQTDAERQERATRVAALNAKYAPQVKELLTPEQFTRLQQIRWQSLGSQALTEPELAKELALTKEQLDKVAAADRDYQTKQRELMAGARDGGNFQELQGKLRDLAQQRDKMAGEALTKEQQDKFTQLKGKPFDLAQLRGRGGRRGNNN